MSVGNINAVGAVRIETNGDVHYEGLIAQTTGNIYVRKYTVVGSSTYTVEFAALPENISVWELVWTAATGGTLGSPYNSLVGVRIDDISTSYYNWNIDIAHISPFGAQGQIKSSDFSDNVGGIGIVQEDYTGNGSVKFINGSDVYHGVGSWADDGATIPTNFTVGAAFGTGGISLDDPFTKFSISAYDLLDNTLATLNNWAADSTFILIGYPNP